MKEVMIHQLIPIHLQINMKQFSRLLPLIGEDNLVKLSNSKVIVFGIGGVGGFAVETLARSGLGSFTLVDSDTVEETNINRQLVASYETIGQSKVEVMAKHILSINPEAKVETIKKFYLPEYELEFDFTQYDYVIDCVDTVSAKISIICKAKELGVPVISAMGAGNKLNPSKLKVADIYKTDTDPLAKVIRRELRKRNIKSLDVVYSTEEPIVNALEVDDKKPTPASAMAVPSVMGIMIGQFVINELIKKSA